MDRRKYPRENLRVLRYVDPECAPYWMQIIQWLSQFRPFTDWGETGHSPDGILAWMHYHNFSLVGQPPSIYGSRVLVDVKTEDVLGVATLVTDDRGVGKELQDAFGLPITGFLGGFMIRRELQGTGLGRFLWAQMDTEIQIAGGAGTDQTWGLFTANPVAAALYVSTGFTLYREQYPIKAFGGNPEDVYTKAYVPAR